MKDEMILKLFKEHDYMTLEEEGFLTPGMIGWAYEQGVLTKADVEELTGWFY